MRAIILAAGRGSRMQSMTDESPKCMVHLRGRPLLEWQISALKEAGASEIAVVTGYRREVLRGYGLVEFHNPLWASTNMVSSLECASDWLCQEPCIVSYSDIFYQAEAVRSLQRCDADLAVTYDPNWLDLWEKRFDDPLEDAETFEIDESGHIVEIGKEPSSLGDIQGQYMGLLRVTPVGWREIARIRKPLEGEERQKMDMTRLLQTVVESNVVPILGIPYAGKWGEIDSMSDLHIYETREG